MSVYFQRLIQQSGLQVQEPLAAPAPATGLLAPSPPFTLLPSGPGPLEIHDELLQTVPSLVSEPGPTQPLSQVAPTTSETVQSVPPTGAPALPRAKETELVVHERVEISAPPSSPVPKSPTHFIAPTVPTSDSPTPTTQPGNIPAPEGIPANVMQAIMRWISAGSTEPAAKANSSATPPSRDNASPVPASLAIDSTEKAPSTTPTVPERVLEIVEEYFESPPPPAAAAGSRVNAPTARPTPAPAAAPTPTPVDPVQVSIGSINVRVEAPPPPATPARPPRVESSRPGLPVRSSHFSKLRRHYILPH